MVEHNIVAQTDFYKFVHWLMYRKDLTSIYSYCEARKGAKLDWIKFFGLIVLIREHLEGVVVTQEKIDKAEKLVEGMGGYKHYFNREMWEIVLNEYGGKLPIEIKALPEGTKVRPGTPLFSIKSLDKRCYPIVQHVETILMHVWSLTTIASVGNKLYEDITAALNKTSPDMMHLRPFMVHDFGFRGVQNSVSAGMLGMSFLASGFVGTDNTEGVRYIQHYFNTDEVYGKSVWATEHAIATSFGTKTIEQEVQYILHQLNEAPDDAIISIVIDSKNPYDFCSKVMSDPRVMAKVRARSGRTVMRPDSGVPEEVVNRILTILGDVYGVHYNDKGFRILNDNIGVLQGDGMDIDSIPALYNSIINNGWAAENLVVGSGGGLLQKWNRDDLRFAIKAAAGTIQNEDGTESVIDISKTTELATGDEVKSSKPGYLKVHPTYKKDKPFTTISSVTTDPIQFNGYVDAMQVVFRHGEVLINPTFDEIINR